MWCKFAILLVSLFAVNANNICKNAREGAIIPDGKDCTVYHQCVNLKLVDKKCDENMSFDAKSKTCVATADANCYGIDALARRFPVIPPWFAIPDNLFPGGLFPDGLFPTPEGPEEKEKKTEVSPQKHRCPTAGFMMIPLAGHCEKYLLCFGGHPVKRSCAPGMHFSREYRMCMPAESADCIATECPEEDDYENPTFIPNPYDCNAYYLCYGGDKFAFECYEDLHWDPVSFLYLIITVEFPLIMNFRSTNGATKKTKLVVKQMKRRSLNVPQMLAYLTIPILNTVTNSSCVTMETKCFSLAELAFTGMLDSINVIWPI